MLYPHANRIGTVGSAPLQNGRKWLVGIGAVVCVHAALSVFAPRSFALTAFGDILQNAVLLCATVAFLANIRIASQKSRIFWALMGLGLAMWLTSQLMWTYIEVYLRHEAPNPFVGDVILFLHIVPMMAAVAIQPHLQKDDRTIRAGTLDFALLLTWWLFLYLFVVIPWQYVHPSEAVYGRSFDLLYVSEELVLAGGLLLVWRRSEGAWRRLYFHLFVATLIYCVASLVASEAIDLHLYYTGSLFDVPLVAAMAWFVRIGFLAEETEERPPVAELPVRGLRNLESAARDGSGLRYSINGRVGAIWRRCSATGSQIPPVSYGRSNAGDGSARIFQATSAGSRAAQSPAIVAAQPRRNVPAEGRIGEQGTFAALAQSGTAEKKYGATGDLFHRCAYRHLESALS